MHYTSDNLLRRGNEQHADGLIVDVSPETAGWDFIHFEARRLVKGSRLDRDTGANELAVVILSGTVSIRTDDHGSFLEIGSRAHVFEGLPHAVYLPRNTRFSVEAKSDAEVGIAWVPTDEDHPAQLIEPNDVAVEVRGGDNVTRQINGIIPPGFDCHRLVIVEVYTPSGGWSSYPPHKHDVHKTDGDGHVLEADLEEIYYYKIDRPGGFAYQRVYTDPESPLHKAGAPIDAVMLAQNNDVVLVPEGYHPVVSAPGYTTYYLNVLAGSAQSLANTDDPQHTWVKDTYSGKNPAIPIYDVPDDALTTY